MNKINHANIVCVFMCFSQNIFVLTQWVAAYKRPIKNTELKKKNKLCTTK